MGFEADGPGFKSWFYQLEVWPWATHLPYLSLPFSRHRLELMTPVPQELGVRLLAQYLPVEGSLGDRC